MGRIVEQKGYPEALRLLGSLLSPVARIDGKE
jgi:hypothetical protein